MGGEEKAWKLTPRPGNRRSFPREGRVPPSRERENPGYGCGCDPIAFVDLSEAIAALPPFSFSNVHRPGMKRIHGRARPNRTRGRSRGGGPPDDGGFLGKGGGSREISLRTVPSRAGWKGELPRFPVTPRRWSGRLDRRPSFGSFCPLLGDPRGRVQAISGRIFSFREISFGEVCGAEAPRSNSEASSSYRSIPPAMRSTPSVPITRQAITSPGSASTSWRNTSPSTSGA